MEQCIVTAENSLIRFDPYSLGFMVFFFFFFLLRSVKCLQKKLIVSKLSLFSASFNIHNGTFKWTLLLSLVLIHSYLGCKFSLLLESYSSRNNPKLDPWGYCLWDIFCSPSDAGAAAVCQCAAPDSFVKNLDLKITFSSMHKCIAPQQL